MNYTAQQGDAESRSAVTALGVALLGQQEEIKSSVFTSYNLTNLLFSFSFFFLLLGKHLRAEFSQVNLMVPMTIMLFLES